MQIRPATVQDVAAIELLRVRTWQRAYRGLVPDAFLAALQVTDQQLTRWADRLSDPATTAWVAVGGIDGGGLVGMAVVGACHDEDLAGRRELQELTIGGPVVEVRYRR